MFKIKCSELTGEQCDFEVEAETKEAIKEKFYAHGAESPLHQAKYNSATNEEAEAFSKKIDEYLAKQ